MIAYCRYQPGLLSTMVLVVVVGTMMAEAMLDQSKELSPHAELAQTKPNYANIAYGNHARQTLDFYKAESKNPTPLILFIHGGGWVSGDKEHVDSVDLQKVLEQGISVASINYRYVTQAQDAGIQPPIKWPIEDAARALQFLRSKANEWNIDKARVGATGVSAGACSTLWLAFHDDLAKSDSSDPIARESTRLTCAAVVAAQTSLDPIELRQWMPNMSYGGHAFGFRKPGPEGRNANFQAFHDHRDEILPSINDYSPYALAGPGDPPVFLDYPAQDKPAVLGENQKDPTHSAVMGLTLQKKLAGKKVHAELSYPGHKAEHENGTAFLIDYLKPTVR